MNSSASKYLALVMELPAVMLALAYGLQWLDGPQHYLGGFGGIIGLVMGVVLWTGHAMYLTRNTKDV